MKIIKGLVLVRCPGDPAFNVGLVWFGPIYNKFRLTSFKEWFDPIVDLFIDPVAPDIFRSLWCGTESNAFWKSSYGVNSWSSASSRVSSSCVIVDLVFVFLDNRQASGIEYYADGSGVHRE